MKYTKEEFTKCMAAKITSKLFDGEEEIEIIAEEK